MIISYVCHTHLRSALKVWVYLSHFEYAISGTMIASTYGQCVMFLHTLFLIPFISHKWHTLGLVSVLTTQDGTRTIAMAEPKRHHEETLLTLRFWLFSGLESWASNKQILYLSSLDQVELRIVERFRVKQVLRYLFMVISYGEIEAHMDEISLLPVLLLEGNKTCQSRVN